MIVDTGSTFTAVPRTLLTHAGRGYLPTQVTFAEENKPSLLGVVTLEDALLAVDTVGQRLVPVAAERL